MISRSANSSSTTISVRSNVIILTADPMMGKRLAGAVSATGRRAHITAADQDDFSAHFTDRSPELVLVAPDNLDRLADVMAWRKANMKVVAVLETANDCELVVEAGVDDFIVAPFEAEELAVRLRRLLQGDSESTIVVEGLSIVPESYEATIDGRSLKLTFKEYELLKHLASNPGRVLTRQTLLDQIWEYDYYGGTRTVDVHVRRLRAKLGSRYSNLIKTVRHVGYKFEA